MDNSSGARRSENAEDSALSEYLKEYQELISFSEENGSSFEDIGRRVDDFYDQHIFDILKDYQRQFMFTLVTLKVYSVFRAGVRGDISSEELPARIAVASEPLVSRTRRPRPGRSCVKCIVFVY